MEIPRMRKIQNSGEDLEKKKTGARGEGAFEEGRRTSCRLETFAENQVKESAIAAPMGGLLRSLRALRMVPTLAAGIVALGLSVKEVEAQTKSETVPVLTEQQIRTVEKVTRLRFNDLRREFTIEMPLDTGEQGRYIVHIAQTHRYPAIHGDISFIFQRAFQAQTVEAQKKIEGLIASVVEANVAPCVFVEGISAESQTSAIRDEILAARKRIDALKQVPLDSYEPLLRVFKDVEAIAKETWASEILYHYVGQDIEALRQKIYEAIPRVREVDSDTLDREKATAADWRTVEIQRILHESEFNSMSEKADPAGFFRKVLNSFQESPDPYVMGAALKLFVDGKVRELCPSEDSALNARALAAVEAQVQAQESYDERLRIIHAEEVQRNPEYAGAVRRLNMFIQKGAATWSTDEREEVRTLSEKAGQELARLKRDPSFVPFQEALVQASREASRLVDDERNDEVVRQIDARDRKSLSEGRTIPQGVPLVFGANHAFAPQLQVRNASTRPVLGLIKITSQEQSGAK